MAEWDSSFTKVQEQALATGGMDALDWYKWAVDMRLTLPLKCIAGPTVYEDSEQGAGQ